MKKKLIFISGYSKLPKGTTAYEIYGGLIIGLIVERETGVIARAECSLVTSVAIEFVESLLLGESIEDIEGIVEIFDTAYYGAAKKAILSALSICSEKYKQIINNEQVHDEIDNNSK